MAIKRYDHIGALKMDANKTPEGYLKARAFITKCGVFPYERPDGTVIRELRHPDEVFKAAALKSMQMMGVQEDHKAMLDADNSKSLKVGSVGQDIDVDAPYVSANLVIDTRDGVEAIEKRGKNQVSCGYFCDLVMEPGIYKGEAYDAMQTNIMYNHLALCLQARLGSELSIQMDSADAFQTDKKPTAGRNDSPSQQEQNMNKVIINGIAYDAAPEVGKEIERLNGALAKASTDSAAKAAEDKASLDSMKSKLEGERDSMKAERDTAKATGDALKAKVDGFPALIADGVKARIELERTAGKVLSQDEMSKLDGKSDLDIKKAVVLAKMPKSKLDSESEGYVSTAYKLIVENLDESDSQEAIADSRSKVAPRQDGTAKLDEMDAAQARMKERLANGGKLLSEKK